MSSDSAKASITHLEAPPKVVPDELMEPLFRGLMEAGLLFPICDCTADERQGTIISLDH